MSFSLCVCACMYANMLQILYMFSRFEDGAVRAFSQLTLTTMFVCAVDGTIAAAYCRSSNILLAYNVVTKKNYQEFWYRNSRNANS